MYKSRYYYKAFTRLVIVVQLLALTATATVGILQPTPQLAQEIAQQAGLGNWASQQVSQLTQNLQPLWGTPGVAKANAIPDVAPAANGQFLTTVHPEENLVVNGSFEMGPDGLNIINIPGWTVASGKVDLWNGYFNPDGSSSEIDLAGTPGPGVLEQTITGLTAGQSYYFEFSYSANSFPNEQANVQVLDGASALLDQTVTAVGHPYSAGWQHFRQTFTAPASGSVKLRFQDLSTDPHTYHGVIIDDVRVAKRLINYAINGSFDAGAQALNQTNIPSWSVASGKVDVWNGYFNADQSVNELDLAGTPGPGVITQVVSGLTAGQSYIFEFNYSTNAFAGEQAKAQVLDGGSSLIDQTVTATGGDANHKGWKNFRQSFTAPAGGSVTLRFQDLSTDAHVHHGVVIDNVRVSDAPINYVVNGDFEAGPPALNIPNDAIPGWTVTSGPVDVFNPGLLYNKMVDLNGSPGNGKLEQTVTGLTAGEVYAFQFNYQNHASWKTYAYARILDSSNAKLYEKRVSCQGHVVNEGWCTLRYFFTAPGNGQVKIVFENDEADNNAYYGVNIDNVMVSRNLNNIVNGNFSSGPLGLNQSKVPGWADSGPTDTHDGYGGEYRFLIDMNGSPGNGAIRQAITGLTPGQPYTLRYNYASHLHNYLVNFDVKVLSGDRATTLVSASQSTDQLPYVGGWKQGSHTFVAPVDGAVQVLISNNDTDNNLYYGAFIDNVQLWGQSTVAGTEINVCNGTVAMPRNNNIAPGGVTLGLSHWVRADMDVYSDTLNLTPAVDGSTVAQWNDQSSQVLDLTQATAGQKPTYRAGTARGNFNPSLDFSDDFIYNTGRVVQTSDDLTMIAVGDTDVTAGVRTLIGMGDNYNDPTIDLEATWISPWFDGGGSVDLFTGETLPTSQAMIWGMRGINSDSNGMHFNYSGEDVAMNMTVANQANYGNKIGLGSDGGGEDWDGRIPEAIVYNRNLSKAEMEKVYSYLAIKYGITMRLSTVTGSSASGNYVSSDGTLVWNYGGNSNYHYDVAGIGRDDASGLEQKQSNSVNSDNLVTIGLGEIASDNLSNGNAFEANQTFLLWGNNNAPTGITTTVSVSLTRMARIWTVQETNPITASLGVVKVRVLKSAFSLGAGQAAFLMHSSDPIFSNTDALTFMACDSTVCEATIDFADGDYFSFARANVSPEISVTPGSVSIGNVGASETSDVNTVTISNIGTAPLRLTSVQLTNDGGGQFVSGSSCGLILNPGANCVVGVTLTPNAAGAQNGVLTIGSDDSDEITTTVNLSGVGVVQAPDIAVDANILSFTDTITNSAAPAETIVISNTGTGNLNLYSFALEGADSNQFVLVEPGSDCTPLAKSLADSENCSVEILFSPTSAGVKSATLVIASNDTDEITTTVALSGTGVACSGLLNTVSLSADTMEVVAADNSAAACVAVVAGPAYLTITIGQPTPAFVAGHASNVPLTVTNAITASATTGTITATMSLPISTSAPISFTSGVWSCATSSQTVTCTQPGPIASGASSTVQVPVTPDVSIVGTQPVFTGGGNAEGAGVGATPPMTPTEVVTSPVGAPDLTLIIGQPSPDLVAGAVSNVAMTVTNAVTAVATTGIITAEMTLPISTSAPISFTSGAWSCATSGQTVTCTQPGPIAAGGSSTVQVPVTPDASAIGTQPVFNGSSSTPGETNTGDNAASPMTPSVAVAAGAPDLTTTIGQPAPTFVAGSPSNVPITVTNAVTAGATTGPITTTVTLPISTSAPISFTNNGNTCTTSGQTVTCVNPGPLAAGASNTIEVPVTPDVSTVGTQPVFNGGTSTPGESNTGDNPAAPMTPASPVAATATPDLTTTIGQPAPAFVANVTSTVSVSVSNVGSAPATGPITTSLTLSNGLSAPASFSGGNGWSCTTAGQTVTCTNAGPINNGASSSIDLPVTPDNTVIGQTPTVTGSTTPVAGETNTGNNGPTNMTPATPVASGTSPDLTTTIGQPAPQFTEGIASNVPMTVTNGGTAATTGPVTATMTLPVSTTALASFTSGDWSCATVGQNVTCTQPGPLAAGASSTIQLPVTPDVSAVGTQPVFNGTASTPGESNTGNNAASPLTSANPVLSAGTDTDNDGVVDANDDCPNTPAGGVVDPTTGCSAATDVSLVLSANVTSVTVGTPFTYTLTISNTGSEAHNVVVTDTVASALTILGSPVASNSGVCTVNGQDVGCHWSIMPAGAIRTVTIQVQR